MTDQNETDGQGSQRWQWVGADPDDMSEDARFRRRVAALTREVMLARGAAPDVAPPVSRTRAASDPDLVPGAPVPAGPGPGAPVPAGPGPGAPVPTRPGPGVPVPTSATADPGAPSRSPDYFDVHSGTPYLLALAGRTLVSALERSGSPTGSATTDLVLVTVARSPRGSATKQLAKTLGVLPSTVSMAVRRLVGRGWVARRRSSRDRRRIILVATDAGRAAAERVAATWRHADDRLLDGLTLSERDELCRLLRRAVSAWAARRPSR